MNNFQRGDLCGIQFQSVADQQAVTLAVTGHSFDDTSKLFDVTHTALNGIGTARIAGVSDFSGTVHAHFDADQPPYLDPPNIRSGVSGVLLFGLSAPGGTAANPGNIQRFAQVPIIVEKVHYESAVESQVKYSFEVKENVLAGVAGTNNPPVAIKVQ